MCNGERLLFKCTSIASEILTSTIPAQMKKLGAKLPNFSNSAWKDTIPEIAQTCLKNKFGQNASLKEYLLGTNGKRLYEASPNDSLWSIGVGMRGPDLLKKEKDWGTNILGCALEDVRRNMT